MKTRCALLAAAGLAVLAGARDASACGGCFVGESQSTQVTGHKMILSISSSQTTLYDQIQYSGNPSSFAWVLPIKGVATIGLSSDALFENLDVDTQVTIDSPTPVCSNVCVVNTGTSCASDSDCSGAETCDTAAGFCVDDSTAGGGAPGPVAVVAQQVVGPYETVQLKSTNPTALQDWLKSHGYGIPSDIAPVIDAYVSGGFDFVALKLVPGQGVSAMKPVRVTTPGASPVLPLRMVAAGTGNLTPITLWILGEGRYEPTSMATFEVDPNQLVWDWDTQSSNYTSLKAAGFKGTGGKGWCLEFAQAYSMYTLQAQLTSLVGTQPDQSGYADAMGNGAQQNLSEDLGVLFANIPVTSFWITRLEGQLSRAALAKDLQIGASTDQSQVQNVLVATQTKGTAPGCGVCGAGGGSGLGDSPGANASGSCAVASDPGAQRAFLGGLAAFFALGLARARRDRRRRA